MTDLSFVPGVALGLTLGIGGTWMAMKGANAFTSAALRDCQSDRDFWIGDVYFQFVGRAALFVGNGFVDSIIEGFDDLADVSLIDGPGMMEAGDDGADSKTGGIIHASGPFLGGHSK